MTAMPPPTTPPTPEPPPQPDPAAGQQPPPGSGPTARPPLRRSATDRMLGGVCGGLAEYSGIDAVAWRVGFVALALFGGAGFLVYPLLWVLMPAAPTAPGEDLGPVEGFVQRLHGALHGALSRRS